MKSQVRSRGRYGLAVGMIASAVIACSSDLLAPKYAGAGGGNESAGSRPGADRSDQAHRAEEPTAPITLAAIRQAWQLRAERAPTVRVEWVEAQTQKTISLNTYTPFCPAFARRPEFEEDSVTHKVQYSMRVARDFIWHERSGIQWDSSTLRFLPKTASVYVDDSKWINLYLKPEATRLIPEIAPAVAFISEAPSDTNPYGHASPVLLHYRALDEANSPIDLPKLQVTTDRRILNGHDCIRLHDGRCSYWADIDDDFIIRRCEQPYPGSDDALFYRLDIKYRRDASGHRLITGWTHDWHYLTAAANVSKCEPNATIEPAEKCSTIPAGTEVIDRRGKKRFTYILRADGTKREITPEDQKHGQPIYEELLNSEPGKAVPAHFLAIRKRVRSIQNADPDERDRLLSDLKDYLKGRRTLHRHVQLVESAAHRLVRSKEPESAIALCREFAEISDPLERVLTPLAEELEGDIRRSRLVGARLELAGTTVDGDAFDWPAYRGKVVLVNFWFTGCKPCVEELPHLKALYEKYHDAGFAVVGISADQDIEELRAFLGKAQLPWETIHEPSGREDTTIARYHITSYPTTMLVGRDGKVIAADVEDLDELGRQLEGILAEK